MTKQHGRIRVAILPFGSQIGRGYVEAFKLEKHVDLVGMTSGLPLRPSEGLDVRVDGLPEFSGSDFAHRVKDSVELHRVNLLYPANDFVAHALSRQRFDDRSLRFDSSEDRSWIFNKCEVHTRLEGRIALPRRVEPRRHSLPLFARPALGARSVGAQEIRCAHTLRNFQKGNSEYLFTEVLGGLETTVDCVSDSKGQLLDLLPRLRSAVRDGVTTEFHPVPLSPELALMAEQLCAVFGFVGQWFFQTKQDCDGNHRFLEASPRASGGSEFWGVLGVNLPVIDLHIRMGDKVVVPSPLGSILFGHKTYGIKIGISRTPDHVFVDFDDTLINGRGHLEGDLIGRLINLRGRQAKLHILSRSTSDLNESLLALGVRGLFNEVIQVESGSPKSAQIFGSFPLFIDDSFSERQEVEAHSAALALSPLQFLKLEFQ